VTLRSHQLCCFCLARCLSFTSRWFSTDFRHQCGARLPAICSRSFLSPCPSTTSFTLVNAFLAQTPLLATAWQRNNVSKSTGLFYRTAPSITQFKSTCCRDCQTCGSFKCVPKSNSDTGSNPSAGISPGAMAGAIVGSLILVVIVSGLFFWYRRRDNSLGNDMPMEKEDIPASAETVLNRPDPLEKRASLASEPSIRYHPQPTPVVILDPSSSGAVHQAKPVNASNPFDDGTSVKTMGTDGTSIIPITLVSSPGHEDPSSRGGPHRPARSPQLNLNLEHLNVSQDSIPVGAASVRSGITVASSRMSYMSNASYASEFLNEAATIVTPGKGAVRQVLGVTKAEVIQAPGSTPSTPGLRPPSSKPSVRSPLAATSFGPSDVPHESDLEDGHILQANPFGDEHSSGDLSQVSSPAWTDEHRVPWDRSGDNSRPASMSTQAGSIIAGSVIDIGTATRVYLGSNGGRTSTPSSYRTTMGKLVVPSSGRSVDTLQEQQQLALAHAQARAEAQGLELHHRASVVSATSTRADSILESFPFVPPSPISDRPIRTPPVSPLAQNSFANQTSDPSTPHTQPQPSPLEPPNRRLLGMSSGSQLSTVSTGLGSFPFQIESENGSELVPPRANPSGSQAVRASLDTLALTNDLSSYPLAFDNGHQ
jgi:protein OPY2